MRAVSPLIIAMATFLIHAAARSSHADDSITFNRDVRPILSDKCFYCHGPDNAKREAGLRLDDRDAAITAGAINTDSPDDSEMLRRIKSDDPDLQMPPPSAKLGRLTDSEIKVLTKWIEGGAQYEGHWSFTSLDPAVRSESLSPADTAKKIDSFVRAGLEKRGLQMQPPAARHTLIRRLSFDLTGLPPSPSDVVNFVADTTPDATERLIDRLLASPHYGERMAVDWLDTARYADSFGFQVDREREMWPWRDWVIRSFNQNMPFDQFVTWQLAGDLLPNATDEQILATAFNRLHQQEAEGGSIEEEYRVEYVADRVQTFATTFLGLTFECARCHDHKYDPISHKEYYQLFAMFQNIDEAGLYSYFTSSPPTPALTLADPAGKQKLRALQEKVRDEEAKALSLKAAQAGEFTKWLNSRDRISAALTLPELAGFEFDSLNGNKLPGRTSGTAPAVLKGENKLQPGQSGNAIEFTGDDPVDLPLGNFVREEPFTISLWLKTPDVKERAVVFHRSRAWTDAASRGYELLIEDGKLKWSLIHFWPGNAASVKTIKPLAVNEWAHVVVSSDGSSRAAGLQMIVNGKPAAVSVVRDNLSREITGGGGDNIALGERFRDRGFRGGLIDSFRVFGRKLSHIECLALYDEAAAKSLLAKADDTLSNDEREMLLEHFLLSSSPAWAEYQGSLRTARADLAKFRDGLREIMVMQELPQPKKAWVLFRGEYSQRREEVSAGTPAALSPFPERAPHNRLGLAQWLTEPQHPLMARVTVNRIWQGLFGRGLVSTSEDFGSQGTRPLYPDVLDLLAGQLIASGWNIKHTIKCVVLSETYRQHSLADARTMADDPENDWLARGPRFRLPAEMIRDNALTAAGLLNPAMGGAPVNPYEMTESFKPTAASPDDAVFRRSVYTNWRRTGPPPAMVAFDAPRRAVCTAKRERTDSPLQALILLNGVQYVEAARVLGESLHLETGGDLPKMIDQAALRCLSRLPDEQEVRILTDLYKEQLQYFRSHTEDAASLLKIGQKPRQESVPIPEAAAAALLAQALLNHDECVVRR